jgi:hypothetical protein
MRRHWNYSLLVPLFEASGLTSIEYFKQMIRRLERDVGGSVNG